MIDIRAVLNYRLLQVAIYIEIKWVPHNNRLFRILSQKNISVLVNRDIWFLLRVVIEQQTGTSQPKYDGQLVQSYRDSRRGRHRGGYRKQSSKSLLKLEITGKYRDITRCDVCRLTFCWQQIQKGSGQNHRNNHRQTSPRVNLYDTFIRKI